MMMLGTAKSQSVALSSLSLLFVKPCCLHKVTKVARSVVVDANDNSQRNFLAPRVANEATAMHDLLLRT